MAIGPPLAHAHGGKEFRLERVTGRDGAEIPLYSCERNCLRLQGIARHEAARLAVQFIVAEHGCAMWAVIGPRGLRRVIAAGLTKVLRPLEQMPAYSVR